MGISLAFPPFRKVLSLQTSRPSVSSRWLVGRWIISNRSLGYMLPAAPPQRSNRSHGLARATPSAFSSRWLVQTSPKHSLAWEERGRKSLLGVEPYLPHTARHPHV